MAKNRDNLEESQNPVKIAQSSSRSNFFMKPKKSTRGSAVSTVRNLRNKRNAETDEEIQTKKEKKPFDKKTYRLKKYSNKYKVQQWEDNRKKAVLNDFYKQVKDTDQQFDVAKIYSEHRDSDDEPEGTVQANAIVDVSKEETIDEASSADPAAKMKQKPFYKARAAFKRLKEDKAKEREEFLKKKSEKQEALKVYRKEKADKFKRLSRKTKKGQPIMKERMEMLLEKIQKMT